MIRQISTQDRTSVATFLASKQNISLKDALIKASKIIKSGLPAFLLEGKDLQGLCWVETKSVNEKKTKFVEILVNNWKLAESFIQILRWNLDGDYFMLIPKRDFLNRTFNKNGIKYLKIDGENHLYTYKFEKRHFFNFKNEDNEE